MNHDEASLTINFAKRDHKKPVIFLHIPKTAGSALHTLLHNNYKREEMFIIGHDGVNEKTEAFSEKVGESKNWLKNASISEKEKIKCVIGHMSFGMHVLFPNEAQYITMMRHPVDRIISHYNYVKTTEGHYLHNNYDIKKMSLENYIKNVKSPELNNGQVRMLSNTVTKVSYGKCESDMLLLAAKNISNYFLHAGIQEEFQTSVQQLCNKLSWKNTHIDIVNSTGSKKEPVTSEAITEIVEMNLLDIALYNAISMKVKGLQN